MGWKVRGLAAVVVGVMMAGAIVPGVLAGPPDDEATATREFRAHLMAEASAVRDRLTQYREAIADPQRYIVPTPDSGPVAVDLRRLPDHALAATYFVEHPQRWDELTDSVFTWDSPFVTSVGMLIDAAQPGDDLDRVAADLGRVATDLGSSLSQTEDEKRALYRQTLKYLRADRDAIEASSAAFDDVMAALGVELTPPGSTDPDADSSIEPDAESLLTPDGEIGVLYAFRDDLATWTDQTQQRISDLETAIEDPEMVLYDQSWGYEQVTSFDLRALAAYETVVGYLHEHPDAQRLLDVYAADGQGLDVAFQTLTAFQILPDDFSGMAADVGETVRQGRNEKRKAAKPLLTALRSEREALTRGTEIMDDLIESADPPAPNLFADA